MDVGERPIESISVYVLCVRSGRRLYRNVVVAGCLYRRQPKGVEQTFSFLFLFRVVDLLVGHRLISDVEDKIPTRRIQQGYLETSCSLNEIEVGQKAAMFHRKRHHHHQPQHSRPVVANRQPDPAVVVVVDASTAPPIESCENTTEMKRYSEPSPIGPDIEMPDSRGLPSKNESDFVAELSAFRRRCTSPVCATAVELAAGMVEGFRLPDHSPSPVRKQVGSPVSGRSLSAASPENNNTTSSSSSSPSSSLTGLFRRKRSPMDLSSQSFHFKSSTSSSPTPTTKPSTPPKPQRLHAGIGSSNSSGGNSEPKGRSLSPMPSGNLLAAMVINSIQSAVLDVGQSASERQSRKANSTASQHQHHRHHYHHHQEHLHPLPQLVINAKSEGLASSEPTSPSQLPDLRQTYFSSLIPFALIQKFI